MEPPKKSQFGDDFLRKGHRRSRIRSAVFDLQIGVLIGAKGDISLQVVVNPELRTDFEYLPFRTPYKRSDLESEGNICREVWEEVLRKQSALVKNRDLRAHEVALRTAIRNLEEAGTKLFQKLFGPYRKKKDLDRPAKRFRDWLHSLPKDRSLEIQIHTLVADQTEDQESVGDVAIPWNLVFIRPEKAPNNIHEQMLGFLGYRHRIEMRVNSGYALFDTNRVNDFGSTIPFIVSLQRDLKIPGQDNVEQLLQDYNHPDSLDYEKRDDVEKLAEAFTSGNIDDDFMYFCCHSRVSKDGQPALTLSDSGQLVQANDIAGWMQDNFFTSSPVIFLNVCSGFKWVVCESFGGVLFDRGASNVVAPQTTISTELAHEFAVRFMERLFAGQFYSDGNIHTIVDVVHNVKQALVKEFGNPFGILYGVFTIHSAYLDRQISRRMYPAQSDASELGKKEA